LIIKKISQSSYNFIENSGNIVKFLSLGGKLSARADFLCGWKGSHQRPLNLPNPRSRPGNRTERQNPHPISISRHSPSAGFLDRIFVVISNILLKIAPKLQSVHTWHACCIKHLGLCGAA
jgi:hypothetical protein